MEITINLTAASAEQKARFQGEAFEQTIAAIREAVGDASATIQVSGATPYLMIAAVQKFSDFKRGITSQDNTK
ncbi:hypothetical protein F3J14_04250 [Burkholderia sp. Tr-862]|uniref:hypothetical protein n=1 Tax=Burkholderia sp. Tr-862 TaxID=2608331 RepID=UPI001419714A|nr:hypothetical protein [Burkholderia sp. Tr-862]NIF40124.1 hypothetical protein [Burkholderia sp. Tr-862]